MTQILALTTFWFFVKKNIWGSHVLDIFVILLLIPASIKSYACIFCNKIFCFECIYLEFRHRSAYNFRKKYRNTSTGMLVESGWQELSVETLKSWFESEVEKIEENGLQVYDVYGNFRINTHTSQPSYVYMYVYIQRKLFFAEPCTGHNFVGRHCIRDKKACVSSSCQIYRMTR